MAPEVIIYLKAISRQIVIISTSTLFPKIPFCVRITCTQYKLQTHVLCPFYGEVRHGMAWQGTTSGKAAMHVQVQYEENVGMAVLASFLPCNNPCTIYSLHLVSPNSNGLLDNRSNN